MAYTNTRKPVDPVSVATAVAVHGGLIALALLAGVIVTKDKDEPTTIVEIAPEPIVPAPAPDPKPVEKAIKQETTLLAPPRPTTVPTPTTDNPSLADAAETSEIVFPGAGDGTGVGPAIEPFVAPVATPVRINAKRDPRFARQFQPEYPPAMIREGAEGSVSVRVQIGTDGRVKSCGVVSASQTAFADATCRQALKAWRFAAATEDGKAVESSQTVKVSFRLPD